MSTQALIKKKSEIENAMEALSRKAKSGAVLKAVNGITYLNVMIPILANGINTSTKEDTTGGTEILSDGIIMGPNRMELVYTLRRPLGVRSRRTVFGFDPDLLGVNTVGQDGEEEEKD